MVNGVASPRPAEEGGRELKLGKSGIVQRQPQGALPLSPQQLRVMSLTADGERQCCQYRMDQKDEDIPGVSQYVTISPPSSVNCDVSFSSMSE